MFEIAGGILMAVVALGAAWLLFVNWRLFGALAAAAFFVGILALNLVG